MKVLKKIFRIIRFIGYYLREIVAANFQLVTIILSPKIKIKPGFFYIPLLVKSDFELLLFSNLLTMTPGTLTVDISTDRKFIYVHTLFADEVAQARGKLSDDLQSHVLGIMR